MELTRRQAQVVERVAHGWPDKVIARDLGISVYTVRTHIERVAANLPGDLDRRARITLFFFTVEETNV